uniref:hypothetical protein n=1 Tax=Prevotella sp. TaxID=59823 RepID=UPI0040295369
MIFKGLAVNMRMESAIIVLAALDSVEESLAAGVKTVAAGVNKMAEGVKLSAAGITLRRSGVSEPPSRISA